MVFSFGLRLLLGLPLTFLELISPFLMTAILLNRGERIVEFKSGQHRFNEVLKAMTTRVARLGVFRPADVLLIKADPGLGAFLALAFLTFAFLLILGFFLSVLFGSGGPLSLLLVLIGLSNKNLKLKN